MITMGLKIANTTIATNTTADKNAVILIEKYINKKLSHNSIQYIDLFCSYGLNSDPLNQFINFTLDLLNA